LDGVIVIDKPEGWTSHDVVNKVRRIAQTKKVGHLGTLDPIATGVLPLVIERATRLAQFYTRSDKIYEGVVRFGWSTSSYDRGGEPTSERVDVHLTTEELEAALEPFRGEIAQRPPAVSAKKVAGRRSYELARKNIAVELEPVRVHVYELTLLGLNGSDARLRVHCSGGTYMRSIAHDLGQALGCGAGWPPASSRSTRRGRWNNWRRWLPANGWWTPSCRRRSCCPLFRVSSWTN
jgi:tRNA pseudouridine55 synthase